MESLKYLVIDANFDFSATRVSLQAMGSSHVALVALLLRSEGFEHYNCNISMGMKHEIMIKILKYAGNDDIVTIKGDDGGDTVTFMYESLCQDKIADFKMKLMDINKEHLGIEHRWRYWLRKLVDDSRAVVHKVVESFLIKFFPSGYLYRSVSCCSFPK
ncbi:hypothetical protein MKX01_027165 [Papaver californicum]|nr:hypothetical protein MKX01_027165 [Papaver californicum]